MKNFAQILGLLFGSAGAHTCPKSGHVAPPPPPLKWAHFSNTGLANMVRKHKIFLQHCWHTGFLAGISFRGRQTLLSLGLISGKAKVSDGDKVPGGRLLPSLVWEKSIIGLTCQSFCSAALICQILQFSLFRKDSFDLGISAIFYHRVHTNVVNWNLQTLCCFPAPTIADSKILLNFKKICLVILKIFKNINLNSKQDSMTIEH